MKNKIKIAPSILSADLCCLIEDIKRVESEADMLHVDIMDGHFVPNITFGPDLVRCLKKKVNLPLDVHLMVETPENWVKIFADVGVHSITFHIEATNHPDRLIGTIKKEGIKAGVALNPATPEIMLNYILAKLDTVLIMTVNPGFGGQEFIEDTLPKINAVRKMCEKKGLALDIAVDGGINEETAIKVTEQGANVLIAGSFLFKAVNPQEVMVNLKKLLKFQSERRSI